LYFIVPLLRSRHTRNILLRYCLGAVVAHARGFRALAEGFGVELRAACFRALGKHKLKAQSFKFLARRPATTVNATQHGNTYVIKMPAVN
jgi:hypothetical protein